MLTRIDRRPAKTFMYSRVQQNIDLFLRSRGGETVVIDAAAGGLNNSRFFRAARVQYLGLDIDTARLRRGWAKHGDNRIAYLHGNILELEKLVALGVGGDIVLCTETINTNRLFVSQRAEQAIDQLVSIVASRGWLIFNVGQLDRRASVIVNSVLPRLKERFQSVEVTEYGLLHEKNQMKHYKRVNAAIVSAMSTIPGLKTGFGLRRDQAVITCKYRC